MVKSVVADWDLEQSSRHSASRLYVRAQLDYLEAKLHNLTISAEEAWEPLVTAALDNSRL